MDLQKTGLKRNLLEQFYTKTEVAKRLCSVFEQKINIDDHDLIIEPAAGTGIGVVIYINIIYYRMILNHKVQIF